MRGPASTDAAQADGPAPVPFADLGLQHQVLLEDLRAAFERVVAGNGFVLGEEVERFEEEFARHCGTKHCVGVASGTVALTLAALGAGLGPGDEVIVPAHTYIASALGVLHAGAQPVFCDVDDGTGLIDLDSAAAAVTGRTAAVLPVHLYGQACDMAAVREFADRHGLAVIEDAAQAHGARFRGARAGSFGRAGAFSFYPSKNLGALGDGGAVCTDDAEVAERVRALRNIGQLRKGEHLVAGFNERLDGLQAAFLRAKLPHLDGWNEARRRMAGRYRELLPDGLRLLEERDDSPCVYHLFPVRIDDREGFARALADQGVQTGVHYSPAVHRQPPFAEAAGATAFPVAEAWAREELSLPMFEGMTFEQVERVAGACRSASADVMPA